MGSEPHGERVEQKWGPSVDLGVCWLVSARTGELAGDCPARRVIEVSTLRLVGRSRVPVPQIALSLALGYSPTAHCREADKITQIAIRRAFPSKNASNAAPALEFGFPCSGTSLRRRRPP